MKSITKEKTEKKENIILTIFEYMILIMILIVIVSFGIQMFKNNNKSPNLFGYKFYIIVSGSMQPQINIGDVVIIKDSEKAEVGEIIAYRTGNTVIVHRVIEIEKEDEKKQYITKGDNNNAIDLYPVSAEQIEGEYLGQIKYIGYIVIYFTQYWGYILGGILIIVLVKALIKTIKE